MNKPKLHQNLNPKVKACLKWHGALNLIYTLYLLEFFAYLFAEALTLENSDNEMAIRSYLPLLIFMNINLLLAARTAQTASLSKSYWIALPVLIQFVLIGFIYFALEVNANLILLPLLIAFFFLPQMHFIAIRRRILNDRRPIRSNHPLTS